MAIKRLYDTLVGATVNVNQLVRPQYITVAGITLTVNDDGSCTIDGTATSRNNIGVASVAESVGTLIQNHVYYMAGCPSGGSESTYYVGVAGLKIDLGNGGLFKHTYAWKSTQFRFDFIAGQTFNNVKTYFKYIDLTAYFGSTIADYLYSLESATAGAGIAKLREWGFFTGEYIPYNAGTLESVEATAHKMVGFNQFDETKLTELPNIEKISDGWRATTSVWRVASLDWETIDYIDGQSYCASIDLTNTGTTGLRFEWHYTDGTTTLPTTAIPANGRSTCVVVSDPSKTIEGLVINYGGNSGAVLTIHSFCINLSSSRNGEYEPYSAHTYDLGSDTLRGLFKLDSNNNLYADGDRKASDGVIQRKYGVRAYQSGDESLADAITDGTNTVYKLATPTTEQSTPFTNPQICDPDGTEEYVTNNGIPVGHETRYQL